MAYIYINVIQSINYLKFHEEIHTFLLFLDRRWLNCKHDGSSRTAPGYRKHFVELEGDISRVYLFVRGRERIMMFTRREDAITAKKRREMYFRLFRAVNKSFARLSLPRCEGTWKKLRWRCVRGRWVFWCAIFYCFLFIW